MLQANEIKTVITPEMAARFLEANKDNRPISDNTVRLYADEMRRDKWMLNGDTICFDEQGRLLNGQHRLKACVLSGKPFEAIVIGGFSRDSFSTFDNGRSRLIGQLLAMFGTEDYNYAGACVKCAAVLRRRQTIVKGGASKSCGLNNRQMVELYLVNPDGYNACTKLALNIVKPKNALKFMTAGPLAGHLYYLIYDLGHKRDTVEYFFRSLASYSSCTNSTIEALRMRFATDGRGGTTFSSEARQCLLAKCWNAYIAGRDMKLIKWTESEGKVYYK